MIERQDHGTIAVLTLAHGKANALDLELCIELEHCLREIEASPIRAIVLTGRGSIFSAGVDLRRIVAEDEHYLDRFLPALERVVRRLFVMPRPVVAAVNGHAIAGGCILVQTADHRLMADGNARIGVPELLVGVPFPTVALEVLRFQVGDGGTQHLACSGRALEPRDAAAIGLVEETVRPDLLADAAIAAAERLGTIPRATFELTKRQLRRPVIEVVDRDALAFDAEVREAWASPEVRDAIEDYVRRTLDKRG